MSHRIGECSSCGATYKLPASFAADRARCKNCGGVVEIGPAEGGDAPKAAPPVPAAAPKAAEAAPAAKPKREGPSMKERLIAARREEEAKAAAAKPAARPAAKAAPAKPAAAKPAAAKPAAAKAAPAKAGARGTRTSAPARSRRGASKRSGDDEEEAEGGRRRGGRREKQKPSMLPALLGVVALVAVGGGAFWYLNNASEEPAAPSEVAAADKTDGASSPEQAPGEVSEAAPEETSPSSEEAAATEETPEATEQAPEEAAAEATPAAKPDKAPKAKDPASVDLMAIEDFGPISGCSETRFEELKELVATMVDPMAGAAGNRAKVKLEESGKEAFPAILNAMKHLDLTNDDQFRSADVCQKALQNICNGTNFGWKYPSQSPEDFHYFDKRVIESWCKQWIKVKDDDAAWAKLAKLDKVDAPPAQEAADDLDEDLDSLDDL